MARSDSALDKGMALFLVKIVLLPSACRFQKNPALRMLTSLD
jgi:hypothetical protein